MLKKIELDFLERQRFSLERQGRKIAYYFLLLLFVFFLFSSLLYYIRGKNKTKKFLDLNSEVSSTEEKVTKNKKELKKRKAIISPEIKILNSAIERKAFSFTEAFWMLENSLPKRSYITRITISSNGKVVLTGIFIGSSAIRDFMESLSKGGKYQVYLTREERGKKGRAANIAWDLKGGG